MRPGVTKLCWITMPDIILMINCDLLACQQHLPLKERPGNFPSASSPENDYNDDGCFPKWYITACTETG